MGFYFANQAKILEFLAEDNDQKLMHKLRSSCELADSKIRGFVDTQVKNEYKEIESVTKEIFEIKTPRTSTSNTYQNNFAVVEQELKQMAKSIASKSLQRKDMNNFIERNSNISEDEERHRTPTHPSNFKSKASFPAFHLQSKYPLEPKRQQERDMSTTSNGFAKQSLTPSHFLSNPTAYYDILKDREVRKKISQTKTYESPVTIGKPFSAIEKKLATFDIRNNFRPKSGYKTEHRAPSPEVVRVPTRQEPASHNPCNHEAPNVDSLRLFRQRIRDKFAKECSNLRRNNFTY